jgi:hypothetical protein
MKSGAALVGASGLFLRFHSAYEMVDYPPEPSSDAGVRGKPRARYFFRLAKLLAPLALMRRFCELEGARCDLISPLGSFPPHSRPETA